MITICHISTLHSRNDARIFFKELRTLANLFNTYFIVADGFGDEKIDGINIVDVGLRSRYRVKRSISDSKKALRKALEINAEIYHLHDPELMKIGLTLKKHNKKVIFDSHEDLPKQILTKEYIPKVFRQIVSRWIKGYESKVSRKFDAIVAATPVISDKFNGYGANSITVCNFPVISPQNTHKEKPSTSSDLVYIGGISEGRGILTILDIINEINCKLNLAGKFLNQSIEAQVKARPAWKEKVNWLGYVDRQQIKKILSESAIGLVLLKPYKSYKESLPVKMFEYMNAGLPVIASDFKLWKKIITETKCGVCVDPVSHDKIINAIHSLLKNPKEARQMGLNGKKAVLKKYNWDVEKTKLIDLYMSLQPTT